MENSINPTIRYRIGGEDENYRRPFNGTRRVSLHQPSIAGQNHLVNNHPTIAETVQMSEHQSAATVQMWLQQSDQRQPADLCPADTHSRINTPENMDDRRRGRKRTDKGDLETLQAENRQLKCEKEFLRQDNVSLGEQIDKLKKKNKEQREIIRQLSEDLEKEKAEHKMVKDKYIELLEKSNQFMNPRFPGEQHVLSASVCGSIAANPTGAKPAGPF